MPGVETVFVLHGLWMPALQMTLLGRRLKQAGFHTELFGYRSVREEPETAISMLRQRIKQAPGERIHLVGHSLGGVIACQMLLDAVPERMGRVLTLGSPLKGSILARGPGSGTLGAILMGGSRHVLTRGLEGKWGAHLPELGAVAGTRSFGVGWWVGGIEGENDGTVRVEETRLPGVKHHRVMDVSHFGMVCSPAVVREAVSFLRTGIFSDATSSNSR